MVMESATLPVPSEVVLRSEDILSLRADWSSGPRWLWRLLGAWWERWWILASATIWDGPRCSGMAGLYGLARSVWRRLRNGLDPMGRVSFCWQGSCRYSGP